MNSTISMELRKRLQKARNVAVLTGAGVSAESGIPTFRGNEGLWSTFRPEELATPEAFSNNPKLVWEWYDWRRTLIKSVEPNAAHFNLAQWELHFPNFSLITQNVDGLHDRAGSKKIIKLHGDLWTFRCTSCHREEINHQTPLKEIPPRCRCGGIFRPGVVWFGEPIRQKLWARAADIATSCELFLCIGTSAIVQPAASLPFLAKSGAAYVVEINLVKTAISELVDEVLFGSAIETIALISRATIAEKANEQSVSSWSQ